MIVASGLRKTYQSGPVFVEALRGVDVRVTAGDFVALMGPSGAGKTTLLNCLSGLDDISEGSISIAGQDLEAMSDAKRTAHRAAHMGFVFQAFNLIPVLTALENVELPLKLTGLSRAQRRDIAKTALKLVGLDDRMDHFPRQLSGGQEQRVAIARAIVTDPDLILADEPTGNLDATSAADVLTLLQRLNSEFGKTVIMVTHDPHSAAAAKRLVHLDKGKFVEAVPV